MTGYIHIRNWDKFQHRDAIRSGTPMLWVREETGALSDDDFVSLTYAQRGLLFSMHLEYGRSVRRSSDDTPSTHRGLPEDTTRLSRRLGQRIMRKDLDVLIQQRFIEILPAEFQQPAGEPLAQTLIEETLVEETRAVTYLETERAKREEGNGPGENDFTNLLKEMPK